MSDINLEIGLADQKNLQGLVVSDAQDKTIVVEITTKVKHPKYNKFVKRKTKFHAHDESNTAKLGDLVVIKHVKPISKKKCWELVSIVH